MKSSLAVMLIVISLSFFYCNLFSTRKYRYRLDEPELQPFSAMYEVDREQYCLTEIDPNAVVEIQRDEFSSWGSQVWLSIYSSNTSRTVAFEKKGNQYIWLGEQEIHYSGHQYRSIDGTANEKISVTYNTREICNGCPAGLRVRYTGDKHSVDFEKILDLTCEDVKPYIEEWDRKAKATSTK